MNTLRWGSVTAVVALVALLACGKEEAPAPEPVPEPAAPAAPEPVAAPAPAPAPADDVPSAAVFPVPEDFEDEAATEITEASYHAQLDTLEKEVEADVAADARE